MLDDKQTGNFQSKLFSARATARDRVASSLSRANMLEINRLRMKPAAQGAAASAPIVMRRRFAARREYPQIYGTVSASLTLRNSPYDLDRHSHILSKI